MAKHGDLSKVSKKSGTGKHAAATMESVAKKVLIAVLVVLVLACIGLFAIIMNTPSTTTTTTSLSAINDLATGPNIKVTSGAADGTSDNTSAGEVKRYDDSSGNGLIDYRIQVQYKSDDASDTSGLMTITDTLPEYTEASMIDGGYVVAESTDGTTTILGTPAYNPTTREVTFQVKNLNASTDSKQVVYTYKIQAKVTEDADSLNADTINYKNSATLKSGSQTIESNKVNYTSGNSGNSENKVDESNKTESKQDEETSTIQYKGTYSWNYLETTDDGVTANVPDALVVNAGDSAEISAYPRVDDGGNVPAPDASDPYSSLYEKYVFMGWELRSGTSAKLENGIVNNISGNFELIGSWKKREYTLSFTTSDGTNTVDLNLSSKTYKWGEVVLLPELDDLKLASLNKRFTGWTFTPEISVKEDGRFEMPTSDVLACANLKQTFTVNAMFGNVFAADGITQLSEGIEGDEVVIKPKEFEGITFKEWRFDGVVPRNLLVQDDCSARFTISNENVACQALYTTEITFEVQNGTMHEQGKEYDGKKVKKLIVEVTADVETSDHPNWIYKLSANDIPSVALSDSTYSTSVIRPDSSSTYEGSSWEAANAENEMFGEPTVGMDCGIVWNSAERRAKAQNNRFVFTYNLLPTGNFEFKVNDDDYGYLTVSDAKHSESDQFGAVLPYEIDGVDLTGAWVRDSAGNDISFNAHNKPGYKFVGWQLEGSDDYLTSANAAISWHPEKVSYLNGTSSAFIPGVYVAIFERNFDEVTTDSIKIEANDIYISIDEAATLTDFTSPEVFARLIELSGAKAEHMAEPHEPIRIESVKGEIAADRGVYEVSFTTAEVYSVTDTSKKMQETKRVKVYVRSVVKASQSGDLRITGNDFVLSTGEAASIMEGKKPGNGFNLFKAFADSKLNDGQSYLSELADVIISGDDEIESAKLDYNGSGSGDYTASFSTSKGLSINVKAQVCDNVETDTKNNVRIGANSAHISIDDANLLLDKDTRTASTLTALLKPVAYNTETGAYVQIDEVSQNIVASDGSFNVEFKTHDKSSVKCTFDVGELTIFSRIAGLGGIMFALIGVLALLALGSAGVLLYARKQQEYFDDEEE